VTRALGVGALRPETSRNWSAGLVVEPLPRLALQVDGYRIDVDDRIAASGVLGRADVPAVDAALAAFPDVNAVQFFTNAFDTRTEGVDAQLAYPVVTRSGVLTLTGGANLTRTRIRGDVRRPTGIGDAALFNRQERSYIENAYPRDKLIAAARWQTGAWSALVRTTRFGRVDAINLFGPDERIPPTFISDVNVGRTLGRYELSVGGNNVLDKLPPRQDPANSYFGIFEYARVAPYGIRGAFWYVNLAARL
jgi:iron complex outermembrane receptor protein